MSLKLEKINKFESRKGPLLLIIMDGVGIGEKNEANAFYKANTPCLDKLCDGKLYATLKAHGMAVGLPSDDDMGNSEVGHNAIGAGRVFDQGALLVDNSIKDGSIFNSDVWNALKARVKDTSGTFHFIGLLSDGNVHSNIKQLFSMIQDLVASDVKKVRLHALLDGRDVGEKTALTYIDMIENLFSDINCKGYFDYKIASGGGRMVTTMDRYNADWSVVKRGWDAHVLGKAKKFFSATQAVKTYYDEGERNTDQYMPAFVVVDEKGPLGPIVDGDSVVFFNFRGDRAIEISRAFDEKDFSEFDREKVPDVLYAGMMEYDGDLHIPKHFLVNPPEIDRTISEYLCSEKVKMFAISETQKFGHVTYFWNGNKSGYIDSSIEEYVEIPSDKEQFDKVPAMKANEITAKTIEYMKSGKFKFGRINLANGDMVGHTGVMEAAVLAMETVDKCVQRLIDCVKEENGIAIITSDHGNCDIMFTEKDGKRTPRTAHTLNPVPFIIYDPCYSGEYVMSDLHL